MAADGETDGYLSSSGLHEALEGPSPVMNSTLSTAKAATNETAHMEALAAETPPTEAPPLQTIPVPALRFPSVSSHRFRG